MGQLYIPDDSWLVCSQGMNKQQLKVFSQNTFKIAGGKLVATIKDRTGSNFVCGRMLIAGAMMGAVIAAMFISTVGLGLVATIGVIAGGALVGTGVGAGVGTLISMIPCFCSLFTMPNDWIRCHPKVYIEGKKALLENSTLECMLGGKIEIHIFEQFADKKLSEIRENVLMEAGTRALQMTIFGRAPIVSLIGYAIANVAGEYYTGPHGDKLRTFLFAFNYPNQAYGLMHPIPNVESKYRVNDLMERFQTYLNNSDNPTEPWAGSRSDFFEKTDEQGEFEGTQTNAFRHTLWQATMTNEYGVYIAKEVGDAHEQNPNASDTTKVYNTLSEADQCIDLNNNILGRDIGLEYPNLTPNELAIKVLDYYREHGLWEAELTEDGNYRVVQKKLSDEQYNAIKQAAETMNRYGYFENTFDYVLENLGVTPEEIAWFKTIPKAKL